MPSDPQTREAYLRFFKNESFDWDNGFICAAHWSSGQRLTSNHLPDVLVSEQQFANLELKHARAKKIFQAAKTPSLKQRMAYQDQLFVLRWSQHQFDSLILPSLSAKNSLVVWVDQILDFLTHSDEFLTFDRYYNTRRLCR